MPSTSEIWVNDVRENGVEIASKDFGIKRISKSDALTLVQHGSLIGYKDGEFYPGVTNNGNYLGCHWIKDKLMSYSDGKWSPAVLVGGSIYRVNDYLVTAKSSMQPYLFVNKSGGTTTTYYQMEDGRELIVIQSLGALRGGDVQFVANEVILAQDKLLVSLYHSNLNRLKEIANYYKEVDGDSSNPADLRQKFVNAMIESELDRFDVTLRGNVLIIGNVAVNLGTRGE